MVSGFVTPDGLDFDCQVGRFFYGFSPADADVTEDMLMEFIRIGRFFFSKECSLRVQQHICWKLL